MIWIVAVALLAGRGADDVPQVNPPVVGRPADFSGAVGGPFVAHWIASPTEITAEEPLTLTLRITGPGNLAEMPRPEIGKLQSFRQFAVEDLDDRFIPGDPPRREFRYRVRPRSAAVTEIPRFKLVYFNPRISPPSRGYQTTYADPAPITVRPRSVAPAKVPGWMLEPPASDELIGPPPDFWRRWLDWALEKFGVDAEEIPHPSTGYLVAVLLLLPPLACGVWLITWSRLRPNAARRTAGRRSRAASAALRALARADGQADLVTAAVLRYVRDRHQVSPAATTTPEVAAALAANGRFGSPAAAVIAVLGRCDRARFGPDGASDPALAADASAAILSWEAAP